MDPANGERHGLWQVHLRLFAAKHAARTISRVLGRSHLEVEYRQITRQFNSTATAAMAVELDAGAPPLHH
eukprot:2798842-Heterocapsa_arctica.AAC.1